MNAAVHRRYDRLIAGGLVPQNRWGFPEDVARAVAAIARGSFDYSSGMIFEVSGGMGIRSLNVEETKIAKK
jgi:NAD(P)-dependent dehydrogenase (short-subunit alcohol dehydrogenase family)